MIALPLYQALVLGVVQGLAEFLPISSSAHLNIIPWMFHWEDPGLGFDVALHVGTLVALLIYFWKDWVSMVRGTLRDWRSPEAKLLGLLVLATAPGGLAGLTLEHYAESVFRNPALTASALIVFALWLGWADKNGAKTGSMQAIDLKKAVLIGCSQALAIIPGVSRSGVTITAGLLEGLSPEAAARFSFLLCTPIILGAALHKLPKMEGSFLDGTLLAGVAASAITGVLIIRYLLAYLRSSGFRAFVYYRVLVGIAVIALWLLRGASQ